MDAFGFLRKTEKGRHPWLAKAGWGWRYFLTSQPEKSVL